MADNKTSSNLSDITLGKEISTPPTNPSLQEASGKRKGQTLRLSEGAWKQLKYLATDLGKPVHELLIEAVNDLFRKYGKPPIA